MYTREITVTSIARLGEWCAADIVQTAVKFGSKVKLKYNSVEVNAKSLLGVMCLGLTDGSVVAILADGADEQEAADAITEVLCGK